MVLYADVLFLIDFSMDVLALWSASRITHSPVRLPRIIASAIFGGIISVVITVVGAGRAVSVFTGAATAFIMSFIAFGKGKPYLVLKRYIVLWICGIILGGIMTALMSAGSLDIVSGEGNDSGEYILLIPFGAMLLYGLISVITRMPRAESVQLELWYRGKKVSVSAICDTGNLLEDPFSGESVIIVKREEAQALFTAEELDYLSSYSQYVPETISRRLRLIPSSSLGGESLLKAVRLDRVYVGGKDCSAVITLTDNIHNDSFGAIVSSKLV
ncbi:MAG: sigma-E processing peptidase SpoIIGA [Clostridia bacterium]|nr:sigma-E processing peptidase SpoIIGA [Clostridia bacterium]